ncbi:MAG: glycosyltransferase family 9 protein [Methylococcaceae bacterium]
MAFKITGILGLQLNQLRRAKQNYWEIRERGLEWMLHTRNQLLRGRKSVMHKAGIAWSLFKNIARLGGYRVVDLLSGRELIAIALTEHMGDIVAAQPIAAYIRALHPKARLVWVTRRPFNELINAFGVIDRITPVLCISEWAMLRDSGIFSRHYDLHVNKRSCPICKQTIFRKTGNPLIDTENYYSFGTLLAIMCQNAGLPILEAGPELIIPDVTIRKIDGIGLPEKFIVLHTRSNESSRDWKADKWTLLAQRLLDKTDYSLIEIGLSAMLKLESNRHLSCCGKFSIIETAEIMRRATLFIGIDSGPAHIANAVKTYGVILKGAYRAFPSYLSYSGGYGTGETAFIISAQGQASIITVAEAFEASLTMLRKYDLLTSQANYYKPNQIVSVLHYE